MTREQQEMELWRQVFERWYSREEYTVAECGGVSDAAVAEFRKRYPAEPTAPPAVWYDEPPFPRDGASYPCWVDGEEHPVLVAMYSRWEYRANDDDGCWLPLNGRRVCPIVKPQEPTK